MQIDNVQKAETANEGGLRAASYRCELSAIQARIDYALRSRPDDAAYLEQVLKGVQAAAECALKGL